MHQKFHPPDPVAFRKAVDEAVATWQEEHKVPGPPTDWFWDLRCKLIDQNLLSTLNCWDICRSRAKAVRAEKIKKEEEMQEKAKQEKAKNDATNVD